MLRTGQVLTIGQLAAFAGCTTKAVRVYHERGLLPEPERDHSGYRRYGADAVVELVRIVTLVRSGVPLAEIPTLLALHGDEHDAAVARIDQELQERIAELARRRAALTKLREPDRMCLPDTANAYLDRLRSHGLSERYVAIERQGWILALALLPEQFEHDLAVKAAMLDDPEYVALTAGYDAALDWSPDDPRLVDLAAASVALAERHAHDWEGAAPPQLVAGVLDSIAVEAPAWDRLRRMSDTS